MTPFRSLDTVAAVLDRANVDTDQIIPARFLRKPRGPGYGGYLFHDLPAVRSAVLGAGVLFAGENFGCGSSREGAVYALVDAGVRCVVAPSFGDIFAGNAGKNGLLLVRLNEAAMGGVAPGQRVRVELEQQHLVVDNQMIPFEIEPFRKQMLLDGLDDIGLTLAHGAALEAWARRDQAERPWAQPG